MTLVMLGLGCDRGTSLETLAAAVMHALAAANIELKAVAGAATIDKKHDEQAILQLAATHGWPLRFFSAEALARVEVPSPSETVRKYMGTPSVSEAAALLAAGTHMGDLLLEKYKYQGSDGKHATVSIAKKKEQHMSKGKILLVGFGPGAEEHMSLRARQAIAEADVVIGYSTYIKLVQDLLDGKEVIRKGMTEEIDRCVEAYAHAKQGKTVALVSSGDIGVYGMAGPTYEVLLQAGWRPGDDIEVEVIPGSTALSACASLVGAPLTHDFCSISLSDLLTPWPAIARRIEAAARADFVIALYNPKSGRRTQQIVEAQRILLQYRKPDTPVAIVKSAYREAQDVQMVRLDAMKDYKIGMLTTVLVGNSHTFARDGLMITPRGYANKYDGITGATKAGEQAGRSLSMGLEGWKACVRRYLRDTSAHSLRDIARHFDAPMGEILSAIGEAVPVDTAGDFSAAEVRAGAEFDLLEAAGGWGRVRVVVRSEAGAVSEFLLDGIEFRRRGDWLTIENEHFHLHIDGSRVRQAWLVRRGDSLRGVHFVDGLGETVFSLSLVRVAERFDTEAAHHFEQAWQTFTAGNELEAVSNE